MQFARAVVPFALALLANCSGSDPAAESVVCDPLATTTLPITAGTFVAAGKDAAGTVYFVDATSPSVYRLFISSGQTLQRQAAGGTGEIDGSYLIISAGGDGMQLQVAVERGPSGPTRMGVHRGPLAGKTFAIGSEGEVLTLLGAGDVKAFTLANLPGGVNVEELATLPDQRLLMVTSPVVDFSYEALRVFFGSRERMAEYKNLELSQPRSYRIVSFEYQGQVVHATFTSPFAPGVNSEIAIEGKVQPLTLAPPGTRPDGATFFCLSGR
jgi:hypothetical protein